MRLAEVIMRAVRKAQQDTRVAMPARVISYDPSTRLARVQILQPDRTEDGVQVAQPVIPEVPVFMPSGGGVSMTFPIKPGDEGIVHFADQDIGGWSQDGDASAPDSRRRHSLTDGMFVPGTGRGQADSDNLVISFGGSTITMTPDGGVTIDAPNGLDITGPGITHNGIKIGDDHVHPILGGSSSPGPTGGPQ